jgi:hypothetical protein
MERLTKRNEYDGAYYPYCFKENTCGGFGSSENCDKCDFNISVCEKLANYEDLEEQGLLLKLPYKAGERVWILYKDKLIEENYVASIQIGEKYDRLCFADGYFYTIWNKDYEEVKKWVYTTKEEAEKAIKKMKG